MSHYLIGDDQVKEYRWVVLNPFSTITYTETGETLGLGFDILPPRETVTRKGNRLLIPCRPLTTDKGFVNVTWTNKGVIVNESTRYVMPNGSLLITEVTDDDVSQYRCVLRLGSHTVVSAPLKLVLAEAGAWHMLPKKANRRLGSAVRLTCHMRSLPAASLTWYKGSEPLSMGKDRYYQPSPGTLQITNLTQEDSGIFKCKGVNPLIDQEYESPDVLLEVDPSSGGVGSRGHPLEGGGGGGGLEGDLSYLDLLPKPSILAVPSKVEVHAGHRAVLECLTDDVEKSRLQWSRNDGKEIRQDGVHVEGQGSLVFELVQEYDAAVYNCSFFSPRRRFTDTQMIHLTVLRPPTVNITILPHGGKAPNGHSIVRITCSAWGMPKPDVTWLKDGLAVPASGRHTFREFDSPSNSNFTKKELAIMNIMSLDSGVYQCIAENGAGVASEGVLLNVMLPNNMPGVVQNVIARKTTSTSIHVTWSPLIPPLNISSMGYVISYLEIAGSDVENIQKQLVTSNTSLLISELLPYTNYAIYIRVFVIENGQQHPLFGEPSTYLFVRTKDDVPSMTPKIQLTPLSATVLQVRWTLLTPKQARGEVIQQLVQWCRSDNVLMSQKEVDPDQNVFDIKDLHPNKNYKVRVLPQTVEGFPEPKHQIWYSVKMPKKGNSSKKTMFHLSVNSERPTEIVAKWYLDDDLRSKISSYDITYNNSHSEMRRHLKAGVTSVVLDDLDSGTCYSVRVFPRYTGRRETGKNAFNGAQTICTLAFSPPVNTGYSMGNTRVKVKTLNLTSIQVSWRWRGVRISPEFFTVKVVNFGLEKQSLAAPLYVDTNPDDLEIKEESQSERVIASPTESTKESQMMSSSQEDPLLVEEEEEVRYWRVTGRKLVLNDLKPLNRYAISVSASTLMFSSLPSEPVQITIMEGVPTSPLNISWKAATPKDVDLMWSPPEHINGHLLYYLVTYSHDLLEWKNHTVANHLTTTQIQDLVSNTNYTVQISGVTGGGRGTHSTVFVYINATLVGEPRITTELVVISIVILFAVITVAVVIFLCFRVIHLRQSTAPALQGNGTCRMIYANGLKPASREHGTELNDYKPILTSLPPAMHNHHLDTKGGPGSHGDGVVVNCLLEANSPSMNQVDVPNENHVPLCDGVGSNNLEDSLDYIDEDDASSRLLQTMSAREPGHPTLTNLDARYMGDSNQVEPSSLSDSAGVVEAAASS